MGGFMLGLAIEKWDLQSRIAPNIVMLRAQVAIVLCSQNTGGCYVGVIFKKLINTMKKVVLTVFMVFTTIILFWAEQKRPDYFCWSRKIQ
jgi:di/tricarboxylate transporter